MYPNPRKTATIRRLCHVDIDALRDAVLAIPESDWESENTAKPNRFGVLDATRHIVFRFVSDLRDWRTAYALPLWDSWHALIEPILEQAVRPYGYARGEYPRIMLARMAPGGVILPHRDACPSAKWPHKIHVPLLTNDKVTFFIDGIGHHLAEGEVAEVSNMATHSVENAGTSDRIHLIFEYYDLDQPPPGWLEPKGPLLERA